MGHTSSRKLSFVEIKSAIGAREDLGRPTLTAKENKKNFMNGIGKYYHFYEKKTVEKFL